MLTKLLPVALILLIAGLNTIAQVLMKIGSGGNLLNMYLLSGILAYGLSTVFYIVILSKLNLSLAYPVVIGLTMVATTISGAVFLKEKVLVSHWVGIGLMLSGISAISLSKSIFQE
jgi:small multidrug resistance pump